MTRSSNVHIIKSHGGRRYICNKLSKTKANPQTLLDHRFIRIVPKLFDCLPSCARNHTACSITTIENNLDKFLKTTAAQGSHIESSLAATVTSSWPAADV